MAVLGFPNLDGKKKLTFNTADNVPLINMTFGKPRVAINGLSPLFTIKLEHLFNRALHAEFSRADGCAIHAAGSSDDFDGGIRWWWQVGCSQRQQGAIAQHEANCQQQG